MTMRMCYTTMVMALLLVLITPLASKGAEVGEVMTHLGEALEPGKDMRANFQFKITNRRGEDVEWSGKYYRRGGADPRIRWVFQYPIDLRGTEITVQRLPDGTSHARIYLPSIRRTRDLSGDTRGESFLGTDFNYEDLGLQQLQLRRHELRATAQMPCKQGYLVESVPASGWWYGKILRCIDRKTYLPRRTEYYDRNGILWKVLTFDEVKVIESFPTATQVTMRTIPAGTSTRLTLSDIRYNSGLPDSIFEGP